MKRFLIITIPKKAFNGFALLLLTSIIICLLFISIGHKKPTQASKTLSSEEDKNESITGKCYLNTRLWNRSIRRRSTYNQSI